MIGLKLKKLLIEIQINIDGISKNDIYQKLQYGISKFAIPYIKK